jgi:hypothetical protein
LQEACDRAVTILKKAHERVGEPDVEISEDSQESGEVLSEGGMRRNDAMRLRNQIAGWTPGFLARLAAGKAVIDESIKEAREFEARMQAQKEQMRFHREATRAQKVLDVEAKVDSFDAHTDSFRAQAMVHLGSDFHRMQVNDEKSLDRTHAKDKTDDAL